MSSLERKMYATDLIRVADLAEEMVTWLAHAHEHAKERDLYLNESARPPIDEICMDLVHASSKLRLLRVLVVSEEEESGSLMPPSYPSRI